MAKTYSDLVTLKPTQGVSRSSEYRNRKLLTFQPPLQERSSWATYFGNDFDAPTRMIWKVPTGVSKAKFELWGGGGHGAGAMCCQAGAPGGSGAYAWNEVAVTPGNRYVLCLGDYTYWCCGSRQGSIGVISQGCMIKQIGRKGANAWVSGSGLTNFCAEGGNPGVTAFCPHSNCHDVECRSCCYCWTTCEFFTGGPSGTTCSAYTDGPQIRTLDSNNDIMRCACYYGADEGVRGTRGYMRVGCCGISADAQMCAGRVGVPYPAGLWDRFHRGGKGGIIEISGGLCCHCCGGYGGPHGYCAINGFFGGGNSMNSVNEQIMRGVGGMSSMVVDGQSCCGQRGGPSAIWISYC